MKKEKVLEMACMLASGMFANPVMANLCSPKDSGPRQQLMDILIKDLTAIIFRMGLTIEE